MENKETRNGKIDKDAKTKIAILTPSFNRAKLLLNCYNSLKKQTCKNFSWYVVDDGSEDETEQLLNELKRNNYKTNEFEIIYIKKENGGKHTALNRGIEEIKEDYLIILDSDDTFEENAVEIMSQDLCKIDNNDSVCGIGYLRVYKNKEVIGKAYTKDEILDTFINQRYNKNTYGDKCELFKTAVLKKFPFPEFPKEKFLSETIIWCRISKYYKMLFRNKAIYICEYQPNGLSDGIHKRLFNNPKGASECYKELTTREFKFSLRIKYTIAYIVYSLAAGKSFKEIKNSYQNNKFLLNVLYFPARLYFKKLQRKYKSDT